METLEKARSLLEEKDLEQSFKYFTDFIKSQRALNHPEHREELIDAYNSRGHIRYLWVDFDDAIVDYSEAIDLDPKFAVAYYNRGQIHYRLGRFEMAKSDLERCLELNPTFKDAKLNLDQVNKDLKKQGKCC